MKELIGFFGEKFSAEHSSDYISFIEFADSKKEIYPFLYAFNQKEIISNGKKEFKSLANGYKFLKLLENPTFLTYNFISGPSITSIINSGGVGGIYNLININHYNL